MIIRFVLFFAFSVFAAANVFAQNAPKLPYLDRGACPFECCTYRTWIARENIIVRKEMSDTSPVAFRVKRKESVEALTGVVITSKAGIVEVLKDTQFGAVKIPRGSRVFALTNVGEGFAKMWFRGKIYEDDLYGNSSLKLRSPASAAWWVKIKNKKGQIGWTKQSDVFDNQDSCG